MYFFNETPYSKYPADTEAVDTQIDQTQAQNSTTQAQNQTTEKSETDKKT